MPLTLTPKRPRFADDEVVVAWQGFATAATPAVIVRGTRLRGAHPAVLACPDYFVKDGLPESEWPSIYESVGVTIARADERERAERAMREPKPIPLADQVVCTQSFLSAKGRTYLEGAVYDRNDAAVKDPATRVHFAEPARPLADA